MPTLIVISTHALVEVLHALQPAFERAHGCQLVFKFDPTQAARRRIENGEAFDVAIATRAGIDALAAAGKIAPDTRVDIGSTGLGVSVRAGTPKPDIGSVQAFKRALLDAKAVVRSREGASGAAFEAIIQRLGVADALRDRINIMGSGRVAEFVAPGELAVQQISELKPVKGADYVGPFPAELQQTTHFVAGIAGASTARDLAAAFTALLAAPATAPLLAVNGLEPAAG